MRLTQVQQNSLMIGVVFLMGVLVWLGMSACASTGEDVRDKEQRTQTEVITRAIEAVPPYYPTEFAAREDINWYLEQTEGRDTWYIYALTMDGQALFYVVSDMKPRNICVTITNPQQKVRGYDTSVVMPSPALDGVYYGGAGCDAYYLRDVATGNFIELAGRTFTLISSKVPLDITTAWGELNRGRSQAAGVASE